MIELNLSELINSDILPPSVNSVDDAIIIHAICLYEGGFQTQNQAPKHRLLFLPLEILAKGNTDIWGQLLSQLYVPVFYGISTLPLVVPGGFSLPVFFLAQDKPVSKVIEGCYRAAFNKSHHLAEVALKSLERLSGELLNNKSNNSTMLHVISELLGCPATYMTSDFHLPQINIPQQYLVVNPFHNGDAFEWENILRNFKINQAEYHSTLVKGMDGSVIDGFTFQNQFCKERHLRIFIFRVGDSGNDYGYFFLALDDNVKSLSQEMGVKIQQILFALKFEVVKSDEIARTINRYYDFLIDELVESAQTDFRKLMQKYGLVQKNVADEYYVMVVRRKPRSIDNAFFHELLTSQQFNLLYDQMVNLLGTIEFFLFERKNYLISFFPKMLIQHTPDAFICITRLFQDFLEDRYLGAGISDVVLTEQVRDGYFQAMKSLKISQQSADKAPCFYSDLGILRYFFDHSNQVDLAPLMQVYREYARPIIEYDHSKGGELYSTLMAYISHSSSPSATCSALFIHKNTLYSRLNKIAQLLGKSLDDSETVFNISLAIKVHSLIQAGILQGNNMSTVG